MLQFFGFKFGNCHDVVLLRLLLIRRCKQKCLKISYLTQICQVLGGQISRSPPDKCRSIVKKAGEAISQTHFPQFFLHFYSDQNRRQTLGLLYFGNFKISINMPYFDSSPLSPRICVSNNCVLGTSHFSGWQMIICWCWQITRFLRQPLHCSARSALDGDDVIKRRTGWGGISNILNHPWKYSQKLT